VLIFDLNLCLFCLFISVYFIAFFDIIRDLFVHFQEFHKCFKCFTFTHISVHARVHLR
jgi:hypothetical protein